MDRYHEQNFKNFLEQIIGLCIEEYNRIDISQEEWMNSIKEVVSIDFTKKREEFQQNRTAEETKKKQFRLLQLKQRRRLQCLKFQISKNEKDQINTLLKHV